MFKEGDQRRRRARNLVRSNIRVLDLLRFDEGIVALSARLDTLGDKLSLIVDRRVRLRNRVAIFLLRSHVLDLVGNLSVLHLPVRGLDEPEFVHVRVDAQ